MMAEVNRRNMLKVIAGAAAAPLLMATKCGGGGGTKGYWLIEDQVWVGGSDGPAYEMGWYQMGHNADGRPFWVKRGSEVDGILRGKDNRHAEQRQLRQWWREQHG